MEIVKLMKNKIDKEYKKTRGITLIALVITIIVLLILAGVSITMLTGNNGILAQANNAKIMNNLSKVDESIKLYKSNKKIEKVVDENSQEDITNDDLINDEILKEYVIEESLRPIGVIEGYEKLGIKDKFGEGYKNINEYNVTGENTPYIKTLNELNNVCAIDLTDGTLYYLENGKMWSISGKTDIANNYERVNADEGEWTFNVSSKTLTKYNGDLTTVRGEQQPGEVKIPNYYDGVRVSGVGSSIFNSNTDLTKITISNGIKNIERQAFYNCSNLKGDLIIPDSVTTIGWSAFSGCSSLDGTLVLSNSLITIDYGAFNNCSNLKGKIKIPKSVTSIGNVSFYNCSSLEGLEIEEGCSANIPNGGWNLPGAFGNCTGLRGDIIIPSTFGNIGDWAFYNCSGLDGKIEFRNNPTQIGRQAFYNCSNLKGDLIIPDSVTTIGWSAFSGCSSLDGTLVLSNSLITIDYGAFNNCSNLKGKIKIPKSVTSIGNVSFRNCSSLEGLEIEEGCSADISNGGWNLPGAFGNCKGLKGELILPETFGHIGDYTFYNCTGITKIIIKNKECTIEGNGTAFPKTMIISGYSNSTAEKYAIKYNRIFEAI